MNAQSKVNAQGSFDTERFFLFLFFFSLIHVSIQWLDNEKSQKQTKTNKQVTKTKHNFSLT